MKRLSSLLLLVIFPAVANASYMGGPEVLQYFVIVLLFGLCFSIFTSIERDEDGAMSSFKFAKFFLLLIMSFLAALVAGVVGFSVGRS